MIVIISHIFTKVSWIDGVKSCVNEFNTNFPYQKSIRYMMPLAINYTQKPQFFFYSTIVDRPKEKPQNEALVKWLMNSFHREFDRFEFWLAKKRIQIYRCWSFQNDLKREMRALRCEILPDFWNAGNHIFNSKQIQQSSSTFEAHLLLFKWLLHTKTTPKLVCAMLCYAWWDFVVTNKWWSK